MCTHTHTRAKKYTFWHLDLFLCIRSDQRTFTRIESGVNEKILYRNFHLLNVYTRECVCELYLCFKTLLIFDITDFVTVWNRLEPNAEQNWPKKLFGLVLLANWYDATQYIECTYLCENGIGFWPFLWIFTMSLIIHIIHTCFVLRFDIAIGVCVCMSVRIAFYAIYLSFLANKSYTCSHFFFFLLFQLRVCECHTILSGMQNVFPTKLSELCAWMLNCIWQFNDSWTCVSTSLFFPLAHTPS